MSDLKPCPFCGGEAETLTAESMNGGYLFGIMCNDCRSRGDVYDTEAEATAAWNNRVERMCSGTLNYDGWYICSNCGGQTAGDQYGEKPNYCASCGARVVK